MGLPALTSDAQAGFSWHCLLAPGLQPGATDHYAHPSVNVSLLVLPIHINVITILHPITLEVIDFRQEDAYSGFATVMGHLAKVPNGSSQMTVA